MEIYAVIMAGGVGSRFWPRSKAKNPKQLLKIFGDNTMIQDTVKRLDGIVKKEHILVITNKVQKEKVISQLKGVPEQNIIDEPFGKNTAACIGLASAIINSKSDNAVMITLPADHMIKDEEKFRNTLLKAAKFTENNDSLVTIGIKPTRPETGYGYIQVQENGNDDGIYKVKTFAEKPNLDTAKRFLEAGDFLWNSGMFIWKINTIINEIKNHMPDLHEGMQKISMHIDKPDFMSALTAVYGRLRNISIDYGIMEKSDKVFVTKGSFEWSDVGSWEAVYELSEKDDKNNASIGDVYTDNTSGSYIYSPKKFTAVIGLENVIVINTSKGLLICSKDKAQDVKKVVDHLKMNERNDLL